MDTSHLLIDGGTKPTFSETKSTQTEDRCPTPATDRLPTGATVIKGLLPVIFAHRDSLEMLEDLYTKEHSASATMRLIQRLSNAVNSLEETIYVLEANIASLCENGSLDDITPGGSHKS